MKGVGGTKETRGFRQTEEASMGVRKEADGIDDRGDSIQATSVHLFISTE